MDYRDWIATTALGSTLFAGPIIHAVTEPLRPTKLLHNHSEVVYHHVSTTGNIIIQASGTVIRFDLAVSGVYLLSSTGGLQRIG